MQKSVFFGSFGRNLLNATYFTITSKVFVIEQNRVHGCDRIFITEIYNIMKIRDDFFQFWPKIAKSLLSYTLDIYIYCRCDQHAFCPGESDYHWVIHMIGPTRVYFKGFSLATGMYFQEKSLATGVKLLYFP